MKKYILLALLFMVIISLNANTTITVRKTLVWSETPVIHNPTGNFATEIFSFEGALYSPSHPSLPNFSERRPVEGPGSVNVRVIDVQYEAFEKAPSPDDRYIGSELNINTKVYDDRGQNYLYFFFIPIRRTASGQFERVTSFQLELDYSASAVSRPRTDYTYNSVLEDGEIYKISVSTDGMHKIDYAFLRDQLDLNVDNVDPRKIKIYGQGGGFLPESIETERQDDLKEIPIFVSGENDGQFGSSDYILFYAESSEKWYYDEENKYFSQPKNPYSNDNYYFIKIDNENGLRIEEKASIAAPQYTSNAFDTYRRYEEDRFNLLYEYSGTQGSGRHWYGDPFNPTRERSYSFNFTNLIDSEPAKLKVEFAGRAKSNGTLFAKVNGQTFTKSVGTVNWTNTESLYAKVVRIIDEVDLNNGDVDIEISYPAVGDGTNIGWLDYIEINARQSLIKTGSQFSFRDHKTLDHNAATFKLGGVDSNTEVWDVTNPLSPRQQKFDLNNSTLQFGAETSDQLREYVAFDKDANFSSPQANNDGKRLANQNIHGIDNVDMVVIYHPNFAAAAERMTEHREDYSGLDVQMVDINKIYNEFSSGRQDPTAIRDFVKMLYDRNSQKFNYVLLFGDGSFDYRNITGQGKNYIPVYETRNTLDPIEAFPSDDYFCLLTQDEGEDLKGALDIAIGRFPVRTALEATAVVQKIINYDTNPEAMGDWRNRLTYNADDEDSNIHVNQADALAQKLRTEHPSFNINKIYFDAYQQVSTPGGERFPKATDAINRDMFKGVLVMNYLGHGGARGWAQERVLTNNDIEGWTNDKGMPLLITATCSFTGYDEPSITSAGEQSFLKSNGGVIALYTTVRAVYSNSNERLTRAVFDTIFQEINQEAIPIGEILRRAKNSNQEDTIASNARKFTLIGDPAMRLAIPQHTVVTSKINGQDVNISVDTIRALQKVTIEGYIEDRNGNLLSDFNGRVFPTIYDKEVTVNTLAQNEKSYTKNFKLQQSIIFKGQASVTNGRFSFTFVVPKDINYEYDFGKISYYATNGVDADGRGFFSNFMIGGTDPNGIADDQGPLVEVFMNAEDFVFGGLTSSNPTLLVKLSDDNGINVVGNSIGHDLTGVLDENTQSTYILNDFYESELDDYTKGEVRFPLFELAEGIHRISVKAWDIANNSGEGSTEFLVASDAKIALDYVLNYPNPFTTRTNFQFEHNLKDQDLEVQVQIFSVSGKLVKTIEDQVFTDGRRVSGIEWDGTDDYGSRLGKGVYLYKIKVKSEDTRKTESDFEKLVILK